MQSYNGANRNCDSSIGSVAATQSKPEFFLRSLSQALAPREQEGKKVKDTVVVAGFRWRVAE